MNQPDYNEIYIPETNFAKYPDLMRFLEYFPEPSIFIKVASLVISILLLAFLIFFLFKTRWFHFYFLYRCIEFITVKPYGYVLAKKRWKKIMKKFGKNRSNYNKLVIKADKIIVTLLKQIVVSYNANNFEERLRMTGVKTFRHPKELWQSHLYVEDKIKNNRIQLTKEQAKDILEIYKKALEDLYVI